MKPVAERLAVLGDPLSFTLSPVLHRAGLGRGALLVDLVYGKGPTAWVPAAQGAGHEAYDRIGLLVFQARRSLSLWYGRPVPVDPLAQAVGWPR